jgi:protoheme IX farnesyltransferase
VADPRPWSASATVGRSPASPPPEAAERGNSPPGPWLRLVALGASAALLLAVVSGAAGLDTAHRLLAALGLPALLALVVAAWLAYRRLLPLALATLGLFGAAALVTPRVPHVALAALAFASCAVLTAACHCAGASAQGSWRDYATLTKPRIMSLLLLTGFCGMVAGAQGLPPVGIAVATMVGLAMACGGASALNHVLDRDIDRVMGERTRRRPVAAGRISPAHALDFGLALSAASFTLLAAAVNPLTAVLALVGNLFYVLVYTRWLKRTTPQNIVIGGAAGAVPPLVGWAAATGELALPALVLFLIVFFWTPPHFWALALLIKGDYAAARVPMLPVVKGDRETARQIVVYTLVLLGVTIVPFWTGSFGELYLAAATMLGGLFLWLSWRLLRETSRRQAGLLFHYSLLYLALLFVAIAADAVV